MRPDGAGHEVGHSQEDRRYDRRDLHPASTAAELNSVLQNLPLNLIVKHQATEVSFVFVGLGGLLASLSLLLGKAWRPLP